MKKPIVILLALIILNIDCLKLSAQTSKPEEHPKKQFITFYVDWQNNSLINFQELPLRELTGTELNRSYINKAVVLSSPDGLITITNIGLSKRTRSIGMSIYPFGAENGGNLMLRFSRENLPNIIFNINTPRGQEKYQLSNGKAYNLGIGLIENERRPGWGFGTHSFILAGIGKIIEPRGDGRRYFVEGGMGFNAGPAGIDVFFGIAQNRLIFPRPHKFYTIPIGMRTTFSF